RMGARHCVRSLLKNYHPENAARALVGLARYWIRHRRYGRLLDVVAWNLLHLPGTLWRRLQVQWRRARTDGELFRRGLIDEAAFPPPHPEAPQADPARDGASWVESPTLLPGHDSAAGRLGPGWYAPEWMEDRPARMTAGLARAFLRASPGQRYRLVATLRRARRGDDVFPREVCLRANGARASATLAADGWRGLAVETTADAAGLVHVEIEAPVWVGHHALGNTDFRRLGVAVIGFVDWGRSRMRVTPLLEYVNLNGGQFGFGQIGDGGDAPFTCFYTSNISLPRDVLAESPFDPTFATAAWEDIELGYRLS